MRVRSGRFIAESSWPVTRRPPAMPHPVGFNGTPRFARLLHVVALGPIPPMPASRLEERKLATNSPVTETERPTKEPGSMSALRRFLVGGIGGFAPVIALLIAADFVKNFVDSSTALQIGYFVRAFALFLIGGFVAWLHETENKPFKIFEIGLGAPALIAGVITANSIEPKHASTFSMLPIFAESIIPSAQAQATQPNARESTSVTPPTSELPSPTKTKTAKNFTFPENSKTSEFFEGLLGIQTTHPKNIYYVIVSSPKTFDEASREVFALNAKFSEYKAEVYAPYADNPYYAVVIGEKLTKIQANILKRNAVMSGLAKDAYIWTDANLR